MRKIIMSILIFILCLAGSVITFATIDIPNQDALLKEGILKNDDINSVLMDDTFTRGEMMVILTRLDDSEYKKENNIESSTFEDIENHWAKEYIIYAEKQQWTNGYNTKEFKPNERLKKSEFSEFILRFLGKHSVGTNEWQKSEEDLENLGISIKDEEFTTKEIYHLIEEIIPMTFVKKQEEKDIGNIDSFKIGRRLTDKDILKRDGIYKELMDSQFTRSDMMVILSRLNGVEKEIINLEKDSSFKDIKGHWAEKYITYAELQQWTNGYGDHTFKPDQLVTKNEFSEFILRFLGQQSISRNLENSVKDLENLGISISGESFSTENKYAIFEKVMAMVEKKEDTPNLVEEIQVNPILIKKDIIKEDAFYEALTDESFTRAELMVILARLNGSEDKVYEFSLLPSFDDSVDHWAKNYIAYAELQNWTNGYNMKEFKPDEIISKVEFSEFILRFLGDHSVFSNDWETAVKDLENLGISFEADEVSTEDYFKVISELSPLLLTYKEDNISLNN